MLRQQQASAHSTRSCFPRSVAPNFVSYATPGVVVRLLTSQALLWQLWPPACEAGPFPCLRQVDGPETAKTKPTDGFWKERIESVEIFCCRDRSRRSRNRSVHPFTAVIRHDLATRANLRGMPARSVTSPPGACTGV